ncbi:Bax inhibitor 1 [Orobanche hederae]
MRRRAFDAEAMLNVDHIAPFQWRHLTKFYLSLLCVSASSTLGSYFSEYLGSLFALSGTLYQMYALLLWYMVYVAAYSQAVLLKARRGEIDYVEHAVRLFTDSPFVLIHCLKLMKAMYRKYRLYR